MQGHETNTTTVEDIPTGDHDTISGLVHDPTQPLPSSPIDESPYACDKDSTAFWVTNYNFNKGPNHDAETQWDEKYGNNNLNVTLPISDSSKLTAKKSAYDGALPQQIFLTSTNVGSSSATADSKSTVTNKRGSQSKPYSRICYNCGN